MYCTVECADGLILKLTLWLLWRSWTELGFLVGLWVPIGFYMKDQKVYIVSSITNLKT